MLPWCITQTNQPIQAVNTPCHLQCGQWYNTPIRDYTISTCGGGEPSLTCQAYAPVQPACCLNRLTARQLPADLQHAAAALCHLQPRQRHPDATTAQKAATQQATDGSPSARSGKLSHPHVLSAPMLWCPNAARFTSRGSRGCVSAVTHCAAMLRPS